MGRLPDFLLIGAPKAGTTAVYFHLLQHPQIFMSSIKEPFFFALDENSIRQLNLQSFTKGLQTAVTDLVSYQALFEHAPVDSVAGEASTIYLASLTAPKKIHQYKPDMKMIAILRNPVDRAYSQFLHFQRDGYERCATFQEAIDFEPDRMEENWFQSFHYVQSGFYAKHLKRYYEFFPKDQIKVFLYEDLNEIGLLLQQIYEFLGIVKHDPGGVNTKHNQSGSPRIPWFYQYMKNNKLKTALKEILPMKTWIQLRSTWESLAIKRPEKISESMRHRLIAVYREDILQLQDFLDRDLSEWIG